MKTQNDKFILDERYENFITGQVKSPRLYYSGENGETTLFVAFLWLLILILVVVFLFGLPIYITMDAKSDETLGLVFLWALMLPLGIFMISMIHESNSKQLLGEVKNTYQKFRRLRNGIILEGEVTESRFTLEWYNKYNIVQIPHIFYRFTSPTGQVLISSRKGRRGDSRALTKVALPKVGTKVYVLYVDDDCHMLL